jgi:hypothetical protein
LLGVVLAAAARALAGLDVLPDDPHLAISAPGTCLTCHELARDGRPDEDEFIKPITELCHRCHPPMRLGVSHPVNVDLRHNRRFPDMRVPSPLYVGSDDLLTCATCHDTHGIWKDTVPTMGRQQKPVNPDGTPLYYKTYYLRIRDKDKLVAKLCDACHKLL